MTTQDVQAFIADQIANRSAGTASVRYKSLRQLLRWAAEEGEIPGDPMARMEPPVLAENLVPVVDDETVRALLGVCEGSDFESRRDTAIMWFFVDTGCRLGEVTGLTVDALALRELEATVIGKGRRERKVPFSPRCGSALDRYLRVRRRHLRPGGLGVPTGHQPGRRQHHQPGDRRRDSRQLGHQPNHGPAQRIVTEPLCSLTVDPGQFVA